MKKIRDACKYLETLLIGNRVTALAQSMMLGGLMGSAIIKSDLPVSQNVNFNESRLSVKHAQSTRKLELKISNDPLEYFYGLAFFLGGIGMGVTSMGLGTLRAYYRTRKHISNHGLLDLRFVENIINGDTPGKYPGYCDIQGAYLAARDYNQLDIFNRVNHTHSKKGIPNF